MSHMIVNQRLPGQWMAGQVYPGIKRTSLLCAGAYGVTKEPTDPIGTATVTFAGVKAGTEIHVYLPDGTEVAGVESCVENQVLAWPVYAAGSPNNTVAITMVKRGLRWQKFPFQSNTGEQSIPIFPQPDLGYSNPA